MVMALSFGAELKLSRLWKVGQKEDVKRFIAVEFVIVVSAEL